MDKVRISKQKIVTHIEVLEIRKLSEPTMGGSTHAAFDIFNTPVMLLRKDASGNWQVDVNGTYGVVDSFIYGVDNLTPGEGDGNG